MPSFEELEGDMDAQVREHLGDSISYSRGGAPAQTLKGFITRDDSSDPQRSTFFVEIDVAALPGGPRESDRLTHSRFGGTVRPAVDSLVRDGKAWIFSVQGLPR